MKEKIKLPFLLLALVFNNLIAYSQNPSLDPTFGTGGTSVTELSVKTDRVGGMVIQPDQKIVICGDQDNDPDIYNAGKLVRLNTDGSMDTSFGSNGVVTGTIDFEPSFYNKNPSHPLEIQPDGKLITVWGTFGNLVVTRFNTDGSFDASFGSSGNATPGYLTEWPQRIHTIALQADGKILVGGGAYVGTDYWFMLVARLNADGSLDSSFNDDGVRLFENVGYDGSDVVSITVQDNGTIVLMGYQYDGGVDGVLVALKPNGHMDDTFGDDGITVCRVEEGYYPSEIPGAMALLPDDKLVVCGDIYDFYQPSADVFLARFDKNGKPDSSFGTNGFTVSHISDQDDHATSMAIDSSGKILIAGWQLGASLDTVGMLLRYNENGTPDSTFGNNGIAIVPSAPYMIKGIGVQADHKIVVAGTYASGTANGFEFAASRFLSDGYVSVEDPQSSESSIGIYPNPARESITITTDFIKAGIVNIYIADLTGRIVYTENYFNVEDQLQKTIHLDKIIPGFYTLTIESDQIRTTGKLVVN